MKKDRTRYMGGNDANDGRFNPFLFVMLSIQMLLIKKYGSRTTY